MDDDVKRCAVPVPEHDDDVRVSVDEQGKVTGTTYHTDPNGPHGRTAPWVVPTSMRENEYGVLADMEERPSYTYVPQKSAELFGLRECQICERHRRISGTLEKVVIYKGLSKAGKVRLTVNEKSVLLDVGQGYDWTTEEVFTVPGTLAPLLGIASDEEDE